MEIDEIITISSLLYFYYQIIYGYLIIMCNYLIYANSGCVTKLFDCLLNYLFTYYLASETLKWLIAQIKIYKIIV